MNPDIPKIITIDGPAGAGKTTLARELARCLTWIYLDTGALYRASALAALRAGVDPGDQAASEALVRDLSLTASPTPAGTAIMLGDEDVTARLRSPEVTRAASRISAWPGVREALLGIQRGLAAKGEVVVEGRDMGTVVFPQAGLKFFLHADDEARAKRRYKEMTAKGEATTLAEVLADMRARDQADRERAASPLKAAPDALTIDSTNLDIDGVLKVMVNAFRNRFFSRPE